MKQGDLVRHLEDGQTGIVVEQRYVFTADNKFKVRAPDKDYWIRADHLTLLSSGNK